MRSSRTTCLCALIMVILSTSTRPALHAQKNDVMEEMSRHKVDSVAKRSSFNGYPYAYYTPETSLAVGAGGIFVFYTSKDKDLKPSKIGFGGMYTISKQYKVGISPKFYFLHSKVYLDMPVNYGFAVDKYFGPGPESEAPGTEKYSRRYFTASLTFQIPPTLFSADRTGIIFDYDYTSIEDKMENEFLLNDEVTGSNGGHSFGIGGDLVWDSRDNIFFPNTGGYQYFKVVLYPGIGDFYYSFLELDVRQFFAFKEDHVIGGQFYVASTTGETPFYKVPGLGGQKNMRGYYAGRYRDNFLMMLQMEYRQYFWRSLGFVVFGSVGNVSEEMLAYSFNSIKYTFGGGLRLQFNKKEKVNLRADFGIGPGGNMGVYFGIEEAF